MTHHKTKNRRSYWAGEIMKQPRAKSRGCFISSHPFLSMAKAKVATLKQPYRLKSKKSGIPLLTSKWKEDIRDGTLSAKNISVPEGMWIMRQTWNDVLFAHWPVDVSILRAMVPPVLELDTYNGQAWISMLPFMLTNLRARFLPAIPGARAFPELNLRTYVTYKGKPGIYFFSLDADHRLAVPALASFFHLPYFTRIWKPKNGDRIDYVSKRKMTKKQHSTPHTGPFQLLLQQKGFARLLADRTV